MRHRHSLLLVLALLCFPSYGYAQQWSGIIGSSRATDWSTVGVQGGIPSANWTQCGPTIAAYNGTGQTIQTAINNCTANHYVLLGAGTFTLASGFSVSKNGVVVRGMGANQTLLIINGETVGATCGYFYAGSIGMCAASSWTNNAANWTAGYSQGTTRITLSNTTGIAVGSMLFLDQLDDASDGWPAAGDLYICETTANGCAAQGGGAGFGRPGRSGMQAVKVTKIVGGGQVDITPPISLPNFRSGQSPGAYWALIDSTLVGSGVEDLSIDYSNTGRDDAAAFEIINTINCWVKGVRIIYTQQHRHFDFLVAVSMFDTFRSNYIYDTYFIPIASYPYEANNVGSILFENNIIHGPTGALVTDGPYSNSVFSYNFTPGHFGPSAILHGGGEMMDLYEGNLMKGFWSDVNHGRHAFQTIFRNALIGQRYDPGGCNICNPIQLQTGTRFVNVIGNVMGDASEYGAYQSSNGSGSSIYDVGWQGNASGFGLPNDSNVLRTLFRWGNWDQVTSTADDTNGDQTGTRFVASEAPSGISNFPNPVPSTQTLPASLYLSAKPIWWPASIPWPAVGPDVSGGNIAGLGGHAYLNPAANCYLNVMGGPANGGSSGPLNFSAAACYGSSSGPSAPTNLRIVP